MWATGPVWTGAENLIPTGIRSPNQPVRSDSLYKLSYLGPRWKLVLAFSSRPPFLSRSTTANAVPTGTPLYGQRFLSGLYIRCYSDVNFTSSCSKNSLSVCLFVLESFPFSLPSNSQPYSQDIVNRNTVTSTVIRLHAG